MYLYKIESCKNLLQDFIFGLKLELKKLKVNVEVGDRVELLDMEDTFTRLEKGSKGTVTEIEEDQELIWVKWDNGEKLALLKGIDKFKVIKKQQNSE